MKPEALRLRTKFTARNRRGKTAFVTILWVVYHELDIKAIFFAQSNPIEQEVLVNTGLVKQHHWESAGQVEAGSFGQTKVKEAKIDECHQVLGRYFVKNFRPLEYHLDPAVGQGRLVGCQSSEP